ncbi:dTDP-4-dehydrorhamnose 3,5-epimerase family protein, partial [Fusobacterium mortiferum]|uniref:dTDP-4-dehydrorhamnose 3,5-epimerase family protein n=1 Tax=Fusobacterium mortiferum TaxID=850 RepID=UPI0019573EA2|nr:dTDP-4-dehydrorhamnose 3,5-epimerase family protein [Fusobacterium mortiferum]
MKFELIEEKAGLKLIKLNIFNDERGKYIKLFSKEELKTLGIENEFVDDNYLISKKGSIRGLH